MATNVHRNQVRKNKQNAFMPPQAQPTPKTNADIKNTQTAEDFSKRNAGVISVKEKDGRVITISPGVNQEAQQILRKGGTPSTPEVQSEMDRLLMQQGSPVQGMPGASLFAKKRKEQIIQQEQANQKLMQEQNLPDQPPSAQNELIKNSAFSAAGFNEISAAQEATSITKGLQDRLDKRTQDYINKVGPDAKMKILSAKAQAEIAKSTLDIIGKSVTAGQMTAEFGADLPFVGSALENIFGTSSVKVKNLTKSLTKRNSLITSTVSDAKKNYLSKEDALKNLDEIESQIDKTESEIQNEAILSPQVRRSESAVAIQILILKQRRALWSARNQIITGNFASDVSPEELVLRADELSQENQDNLE